MKVAYCRVSSYGQSLDVQLEKLKDCDKIFQEKVSAKTDNREQLQAMLDFVREGDEIWIVRLDRISRNVRDLFKIVSLLEKKGVSLKVLDQDLDTSTAQGRMMFGLLGIISEFENDLRKQRQMEGIKLAKERGVKLGRKKALSDADVQAMRQQKEDGVEINELMKQYKLSRASIYNYL